MRDDGDSGDALKQEGMERADDHANLLWKAAAMDAIWRAAHELPEFSSDDVMARIDPSTYTHNLVALGPRMLEAAKSGWMEKAHKVVNSKRSTLHSSPRTVWRSLLRGEDEDVNTHSSILGGSNAARLLACPASYAEQLKNPQTDVTSVYAEEGTMLHSMIAGMVGGEGAVEDMITDDQAEVLMTAKQTLDGLKAQYGGKFRIVGVESMLPLPGVTGAFGSVDLVLSNKTTVLVVDWKFGKGIPVKALYEKTDGTEVWDEVNPQLAFYAAAARARFRRSFKNKTIVLAIIQPRFPQPLDAVEVTDLELDEFLVAFQQAYLQALGRNARREKGEHCRFASCKATCPLWVGPVIEMSVLDPKRAALEASTRPIEATSDYGAYLSKAMHLAVLAETWAGEIRKQAHVYLEDGGLIPEWKLVPKRGMRKWVSEDDAVADLMKIGAVQGDIFSLPELRSVAQVEKSLKAKGIALPEDLWMLSSSGSTIAPSDDPRPETTHGQVVDNARKALKAL